LPDLQVAHSGDHLWFWRL